MNDRVDDSMLDRVTEQISLTFNYSNKRRVDSSCKVLEMFWNFLILLVTLNVEQQQTIWPFTEFF